MSDQPLRVRVAAITAIEGICVEIVRQKKEPCVAISDALKFLHAVAAGHPSAPTSPELDEHLKARGFGEEPKSALAGEEREHGRAHEHHVS